MNEELFYGIALSLMKGIGDSNAKTLISYTGSTEEIFKTPISKLQKISGVGPKLSETFKDTAQVLARAEKEIAFIQKNNIKVHFYYDKKYPKRLLNCSDSPLFIFSKGNVDFNEERFVNIVGTRHATEYGKETTEKLIADLAKFKVNLVSGLAYGIDISAHKAALKYDIQNIAVLAHGLDRIYPAQHKNTAEKLQQNGALVTTYLSETNPDRQNFPDRNKIVAGMTDATIVVESAIAGGALITAEIANNYNRDIFAFPGRITDEYSQGCLKLIKNHKANLVTSAQDIIEFMNWDLDKVPIKKEHIQPQLFIELDEHELVIVNYIRMKDKVHIDELNLSLQLKQSNISTILLQLEMKGVIVSLPGKMYKVV